jgi:hypothetical protein
MTCEQAKERMVDRWVGAVDPAAGEELDTHLKACAECRQESQLLDAVWRGLGGMPVEEPSSASYVRFQEMLAAYRLGAAQAARERRAVQWSWLTALWPTRPLMQFATAALMLVAGLGVGHWMTGRYQDQERLARLGDEVKNMRQLITLSLLQQQSASERLRGVNWSVRVEAPDSEVLNALMRTLNSDPNVNVRLAAVDALQHFSSDMRVRRGLRESLAMQTSPLVQLALIDWAVDSADRQSVDTLDQLQKQPDVNPAVKVRLTRAIDKLR